MLTLTEAVTKLLSEQTIKGTGNEFDNNVLQFIAKEANLTIITADDWKENYKDCKAKTHKHDFDFSSCNLDKTLNNVIVDKPNGSQQWPDLLVIKNNAGLPLELKGGKDKPQWNSTSAKLGYCYLAYSSKADKIVAFMGDEIITEEDIEIYQKIDEKHKAIAIEGNAEFVKNGSSWRYYERGKRDYYGNLFDNSEVNDRSGRLLEHLREFETKNEIK